MARYKELCVQREQYELAGKALKEVKSRVKGYLVPSLSKVASHLLNQMTGGERSVVEISEDFEIVVDGQSLRTLSGSGKDITNLAIRIALGQVLTHKVFPLMMFDEIDAAMDDTRAQYTWDCIQKITPLIGQVLLVSHKDLNSTHRISV
jgi:DNA repair exonuclease SbcCD ATPase subunit